MSLSVSTTTTSTRLSGRTVGRKLPKTSATTPNQPTKASSKPNNLSVSKPKVARSRLTSQGKSLELRTPTTAARRPTVALNVVSEESSKSLARTPLTAKPVLKTRLPRIVATPQISSSVTRKLKVEDLGHLQIQTSTATPSLSSSPGPTPQHSPAQSTCNIRVTESIDADKTPKLTSRVLNSTRTLLNNNPQTDSSQVRVSNQRLAPIQDSKAHIPFPSAVEEPTPKRPLTRARSKHLLNISASSSASQAPQNQTGIPQIKRQPSRVKQLTEAFQKESESKNACSSQTPPSLLAKPLASANLLDTTLSRRPSNGSISSILSPPNSSFGNSPNITALAASLSKQHVQRNRLSHARSFQSSFSDTLRFSTMSTLGALKWEDGVGDVLLTDPNETEAMVADISMSKLTPLKQEAQSAAIALASARANFLGIVQGSNQQQQQSPLGVIKQDGARIENGDQTESPSFGARLRRKPSSSLTMINESLPLPGSNKGLSSLGSKPVIRKVIGKESQVAALTQSLEQSLARELELRKEIESLREAGENYGVRRISMVKKLSDQEREKSLVEEIQRLENELEEFKEINIELENSLDHIKFENFENLKKFLTLNEQHQILLTKFNEGQTDKSNNSSTMNITNNTKNRRTRPDLLKSMGSRILKGTNDEHQDQDQIDRTEESFKYFESYRIFNDEISKEINFIQDQLKLVQFIKLSLALNADLSPFDS